MALARALHDLALVPGVTVGGLTAFLAASPPVDEVEITSPSSWSCAHGVERWRADCGDVTGGDPGWNQRWRAPLRTALDLLALRTADAYERAAAAIVEDPWATRDAYGAVIDGTLADRRTLVRAHSRSGDPDPESVSRMLGLLEMQRHALLASSSCAWFFADCAGIETRQSLRHAARAVELATALTGEDLAPAMARTLAPMRSNDPTAGDGRRLWGDARGAAVTPERLGAWWAAATLAGVECTRIGRVRIDPRDLRGAPGTTADVPPPGIVARVEVTDETTGAVTALDVAGATRDARLVIGVGPPGTLAEREPTPDPTTLAQTLRGDPRLLRLGLPDLPEDARRTVLRAWWRQAGAAGSPTITLLRGLVDATATAGIRLDDEHAEQAREVLCRAAVPVIRHATRAPVGGMRNLAFVARALAGDLPPHLRWAAQNALLSAREHTRPAMLARASADPRARRWLDRFERTANLLGVSADPP
ncbi:MAG: hypothetical protein AMXMBFR46_10910 [Acidimicrobiia bacterium]